MRNLSVEGHKSESESAAFYFSKAIECAKESTCLRVKCGSIIVKDLKIIGQGYNSPPGALESQRRCECNKNSLDRKVTDKTCCIHAEQRAIMNALRTSPRSLAGAKIYFTRLDEHGDMAFSGRPYCTICSKMALDCGIKEFVLWHKEGICSYPTDEYNKLSFAYKQTSGEILRSIERRRARRKSS